MGLGSKAKTKVRFGGEVMVEGRVEGRVEVVVEFRVNATRWTLSVETRCRLVGKQRPPGGFMGLV